VFSRSNNLFFLSDQKELGQATSRAILAYMAIGRGLTQIGQCLWTLVLDSCKLKRRKYRSVSYTTNTRMFVVLE